MRARTRIQNWSIGKKTMASHLLIASISIVIATVLCYLFGYQYTRTNAIEELERQVTAIAHKESYFDINERASRSYVVEMYQKLTNAAVFFVNREGEALRMQRYVPPTSLAVAAPEDGSGASAVQETEYSTVELFDNIDRQFIDRILQGETVTTVRKFVFAGGVIIFSGAPILNSDGEAVGCIILAQPVEIMRAVSRELGFTLFIAACIAVAAAVLLAVAQTRMLVRPVQRMTRAARRMADGDYDHRVCIASNDEIGELGRTLNTLSLRLMETIESLREERDRLEVVIGSIEEGLLAVDGQMRAVHFNMAFLCGMELDNIDELRLSQREDVAGLRQALEKTLQSRERCKVELTNPSGRALLAEISALHDNGEIGAVCLLADVSEAQRMEQLRRDYVANISHELRTPLTGIRGMIEPLLDGYVDTEEERQNCYSIIQKETVRLEKLVGEMLDMSRLQDGRITVELEPMELPGILQAAVRNMEGLAQKAGVTLDVETDGSRLSCMGNEDRIMQVLIILLDNAIGFTPGGGRVTVFARQSGTRQVVVGVRDTGCGIELRDLPLIWERFYKADRSRMRTKGTGLGLSIAKLVVELMGGEISVRSKVGHGSEFSFTLASTDF